MASPPGTADPNDGITVITGLEKGPLERLPEAATCTYCNRTVYIAADHAPICPKYSAKATR
ncbi:hypothetical protein E1265_00890 [Streptomyces sp. 8K308]|uniref:hypothetical protein n=1 Tax=Streptomyces sp. 8K308 TaxID=2530388 RepID=UPI001050CC9C|nr:hypothetical protein [Streptomyces sp. 8K308]TDC27698.1 hypothetical protein E1265_00890 [Streptomyces sp. 8K308]